MKVLFTGLVEAVVLVLLFGLHIRTNQESSFVPVLFGAFFLGTGLLNAKIMEGQKWIIFLNALIFEVLIIVVSYFVIPFLMPDYYAFDSFMIKHFIKGLIIFSPLFILYLAAVFIRLRFAKVPLSRYDKS